METDQFEFAPKNVREEILSKCRLRRHCADAAGLFENEPTVKAGELVIASGEFSQIPPQICYNRRSYVRKKKNCSY